MLQTGLVMLITNQLTPGSHHQTLKANSLAVVQVTSFWKWKKTQRENGGCVGKGDFILTNEKGGMVSKSMAERWVQDYLTENHLRKGKQSPVHTKVTTVLL